MLAIYFVTLLPMKPIYRNVGYLFMAAIFVGATPAAAQSVKSLAPAPVVAPVPEGSSATRDDLLGSYIWDEYSYSNSHLGWNYMYCVPEIVAGTADDEVVINGFWSDFDDYGNPISSVVAKFDAAKSTLSFESGTYLGTYGEYPAYIYISDWNTDILEAGPITFTFNPESRQLIYQCDFQSDGVTPVKTLLVTSYPDAIGTKVSKGVDFIGYIRMSQYNTAMNLTNTTLGESGVSWGYVAHNDNGFTYRNFAGYGFDIPLEFTIDFANMRVVAPSTLCKADALLSDNTRADIYYAGIDGGDIVGSLEPTAEAGVYTVDIPEWALYNATASKVFMNFSDTRFTIRRDPAGVHDAACESEASTVEYFDLYGRRVANPAANAIYIERRGSSAKKIVR